MPAVVLSAVRAAFSDAEFVELGYVVGQFIGMGQFVHLLGVTNPSVMLADEFPSDKTGSSSHPHSSTRDFPGDS